MLQLQAFRLLIENLFRKKLIEILDHLQTFNPGYFSILGWLEGEAHRLPYHFNRIESEGDRVHLILQIC